MKYESLIVDFVAGYPRFSKRLTERAILGLLLDGLNHDQFLALRTASQKVGDTTAWLETRSSSNRSCGEASRELSFRDFGAYRAVLESETTVLSSPTEKWVAVDDGYWFMYVAGIPEFVGELIAVWPDWSPSGSEVAIAAADQRMLFVAGSDLHASDAEFEAFVVHMYGAAEAARLLATGEGQRGDPPRPTSGSPG
jgi:hypothetical protein